MIYFDLIYLKVALYPLWLSKDIQKTLNIPNKANLKMTQMFVTKVLTTDYNRMDTWYRGKNKANSKPICASPALTLRQCRKVSAVEKLNTERQMTGPTEAINTCFRPGKDLLRKSLQENP